MFEEIRKAAVPAVSNIFETMFFTFLEPVEENRTLEETFSGLEKVPGLMPQSTSPYFLKSEICFSGDRSGQLRLLLPYDLSQTLTMNFMGFEEEVTEPQILDMACELANMICGNLFSSLDKTSVTTLSSPLIQKIFFQVGLEQIESADLTLNFLAERQPITIQILFDKSR